MTDERRDSLITSYTNDVKLTDSEVLHELEIIKTYKGNEVILFAKTDQDTLREYKAIDAACELYKLKIEQEQINIPEYDKAINELESNSISSSSISTALKALKQLKDLQIKINNHKSIYPR